MKKILYLQQNGLTSIVSGTPDTPVSELEKAVPVGLSYIVVDESVLPPEEHLEFFRDALTADFDSPGQPKVEINADVARELAKNYIRAYRAPKFAQNDIVLRDAMLSDDQVTIASAKKERDRLKTLTYAVDGVSNIDELITIVKSFK